jgi:lipid II:glycine glycyltransferase (peptidoglycan interpeptide bridge formation enzyme)
MQIRDIQEKDKVAFNTAISHPLQSYEWGEFRKKTGIKVIRRGFFDLTGGGRLAKAFTLTIHKIPKTPFTIGYLPKGDMPDQELLNELKKIGIEERCIFIQLEPNVRQMANGEWRMEKLGIKPAAHPLFTKFTFVLDLNKSEDELLKGMHSKARYNIKVAKKHGVEIIEDNSDKAFEEYWKLMQETTTRQKFYAHTKKYHRLMWETLKGRRMANGKWKMENLNAHLFLAKYNREILTAWVLFTFKDTLYYPYGASSNEHREVMASNLIMWEAIRFGKKLGLKKFDMWGALGTSPDPKDPWFGFHNFKQKYNPEHIEFIGSYDLVINPLFYQAYKLADKLRWVYLKIKKII